jgi:hypothetical protein
VCLLLLVVRMRSLRPGQRWGVLVVMLVLVLVQLVLRLRGLALLLLLLLLLLMLMLLLLLLLLLVVCRRLRDRPDRLRLKRARLCCLWPQKEVKQFLVAVLLPQQHPLGIRRQGGQITPKHGRSPRFSGHARGRAPLFHSCPARGALPRRGGWVAKERRLYVLRIEPLTVLHALPHPLGKVVRARISLVARRHGALGGLHRLGEVARVGPVKLATAGMAVHLRGGGVVRGHVALVRGRRRWGAGCDHMRRPCTPRACPGAASSAPPWDSRGGGVVPAGSRLRARVRLELHHVLPQHAKIFVLV